MHQVFSVHTVTAHVKVEMGGAVLSEEEEGLVRFRRVEGWVGHLSSVHDKRGRRVGVVVVVVVLGVGTGWGEGWVWGG